MAEVKLWSVSRWIVSLKWMVCCVNMQMVGQLGCRLNGWGVFVEEGIVNRDKKYVTKNVKLQICKQTM